ncbi:MAG: nitronate monooxygenase, partial [Lachnospiraceae bacterium]|nr:nitronate monooxygenase [Lachnospiraceae bacterium]
MKIGRKEIRVPIIQGGMGVGISLGGLAGAVAKEGAVGIISAAQTGFREADFYENTLQANLRAMGKEWNKARNTAEHGVIG